MNRAVVTTDHVTATLLAYAPQGVAAGQPLQLGLQLVHKDGWHTYWKNPGDSGLPVTLKWTLPAGSSAGDIAWPVPQRLPYGPLMNYGYDGTVLLPVPVRVGAGGALDVKLQAEWLVCKDICLPESGEFALRLEPGVPLRASRAAFDAAVAAAPRPARGVKAAVRIDGAAVEFAIDGLPAGLRGKQLQFFPEDGGVFEHAAAATQRWSDGRLMLRAPLSSMRSESPAVLKLVLAEPGVAGGIALDAPVAAWPGPASVTGSAPGATAGLGADASASPGASVLPGASASPGAGALPGAASTGAASVAVTGDVGPGLGIPAGALPVPAGSVDVGGAGALPAMLLFAFLGGALLNLMPCVFPVLSLKAVALAQRGEERGRQLAGGIAYTVGVVASFLALAGALLALRAGGAMVGWGFQLQSPLFIVALALLFTLIGLNLLGVFEVGTLLPGRLAAYRARNPLLDDALTGAVAVAIASPCTAPLMGAAVGAALAAPWPQALSIFAALGLGMAAPYLALSTWPQLARALPRPGPWMVRFKALLAFPMFATVVWLAWVLGHQTGVDGMAALLVLLLAASLAAWLWAGMGSTRGTRSAGRTAAVGCAGLALLAGALAWSLPLLQAEPGPAATLPPQPTMTAAGAAAPPGGGGLQGSSARQGNTAPQAGAWQPWSPQAVAQARDAGRPVFVDFTAAWCITCQFNKRTTLSDPAILSALAQKQVLLLRADWTSRDPLIAHQLQALGRSGVPVYVLYGDTGSAPQLLPEVLSADAIHSALSRL